MLHANLPAEHQVADDHVMVSLAADAADTARLALLAPAASASIPKPALVVRVQLQVGAADCALFETHTHTPMISGTALPTQTTAAQEVHPVQAAAKENAITPRFHPIGNRQGVACHLQATKVRQGWQKGWAASGQPGTAMACRAAADTWPRQTGVQQQEQDEHGRRLPFL